MERVTIAPQGMRSFKLDMALGELLPVIMRRRYEQSGPLILSDVTPSILPSYPLHISFGRYGGIHITKTTSLVEFLQTWAHPYGPFPGIPVVASVRCLGVVAEHEHGYRAEKILIDHIYLFTKGRQFTRKFIDKIERRYQCTVSQERYRRPAL